jgi:hypothetical protein
MSKTLEFAINRPVKNGDVYISKLNDPITFNLNSLELLCKEDYISSFNTCMFLLDGNNPNHQKIIELLLFLDDEVKNQLQTSSKMWFNKTFSNDLITRFYKSSLWLENELNEYCLTVCCDNQTQMTVGHHYNCEFSLNSLIFFKQKVIFLVNLDNYNLDPNFIDSFSRTNLIDFLDSQQERVETFEQLETAETEQLETAETEQLETAEPEQLETAEPEQLETAEQKNIEQKKQYVQKCFEEAENASRIAENKRRKAIEESSALKLLQNKLT